MSAPDLQPYLPWLERRERSLETLSPVPAQLLAATLDLPAERRPQAELAGKDGIGRGRRPEQREIDPVGRNCDPVAPDPAGHEIVAQPGADRDHGIGAGDDPVLEGAGQAVLERAGAPGAVAHRGILPEGPDLVDQRHVVALRHAQRRVRLRPAAGIR